MLLVEGEFSNEGINEVVFMTLTLCDLAKEDFVGIINRAARRGNAVWEVIFRGVAATGVGAMGLLSRDTGRVVEASSTSVRLTRFATGFPSPSRVGGTSLTVDCERGKLEPVRSILDCVRFNGVGGILLAESVIFILDWVRFSPLAAGTLDSAMFAFDCVRLSLLASGLTRSGFEGDFFSC